MASAVLALCALATAGCKRPPPATAPAQGAAAPLSAWPQGRAAPMRITEELTLAVPLEFERDALDGEPPASGTGVPGSAPPGAAHGEVHFDFFLPDFTGHTLENYRRESDVNRVEVVYLHAGDSHEADPGAPGEYPPNMLRRALAEAFDPRRYRDEYGLRCYQGRALANRMACYGRRDPQSREDIMLSLTVPPYPAELDFPAVEARYFTRRYGGVRIRWRAHVSQLPRWRAIDAQIWKFIDAWRVAPAGGAPTAPVPAAPAGPGVSRN